MQKSKNYYVLEVGLGNQCALLVVKSAREDRYEGVAGVIYYAGPFPTKEEANDAFEEVMKTWRPPY